MAESAPRGRHGHLLEDSTNPDLKFEWEVPNPTRDYAQEKLNAAQERYLKRYPNADMDSLLWRVSRDV